MNTIEAIAAVLFLKLEDRKKTYNPKQLDAFTAGWTAASLQNDADIRPYKNEPDKKAYVDGYCEMVNLQQNIQELIKKNVN